METGFYSLGFAEIWLNVMVKEICPKYVTVKNISPVKVRVHLLFELTLTQVRFLGRLARHAVARDRRNSSQTCRPNAPSINFGYHMLRPNPSPSAFI
jgi:hypothetical protein